MAEPSPTRNRYRWRTRFLLALVVYAVTVSVALFLHEPVTGGILYCIEQTGLIQPPAVATPTTTIYRVGGRDYDSSTGPPILPLSVHIVTAIIAWLGPAMLAILAYHRITVGGLTPDGQTYCGECGYILRGLTEPRCPECGVRI